MPALYFYNREVVRNMNQFEEKKLKQINDILSVVKLCSLLFSGIGFFRYFMDHSNFKAEDGNNLITTNIIIITILMLALIYCIWILSTSKKTHSKYFKYIKLLDNFVLILIFFAVIIITGKQASQYKFLFLFIIITTTIQSGMKHGLIIAFISSAIILTMDILCLPNVKVNQYFENDLILSGIFILTAWPLGYYVKTESIFIAKLKDLANEDGLTGVYNHRFFYDALKSNLDLCKKEQKPISMIFIDIDYFKHYNDLYGHQRGDEVLKKIACILKDNIRNSDILARYGGEEFSIILPDASEEEALKIAEKLRYEVETTSFDGEENQPNGKITVSIGVSVYPDKAKSDVDLIKSADDALYRAKFFNKNRVESYISILDELKNDIEEEHIDLITSIKTLISVINAKDKYTYGHVERVVVYCRMLADKLGLDEETKKRLIYGAYMHDIGKINISEDILIKKMPLTNSEWEILKQHPKKGIEIIEPVKSLEDISPLILHHHERYDGTGYPNGLKGTKIPFLARLLAVVDSFDAMTSNRPYNARKTYLQAIEELKRCKGTQFDPEITDAFIDIIEKKGSMFTG